PPARLNGLYPRKGLIAPGADADLAIWDPQATTTLSTGTLHMATDYTPYEGREVRGLPITVMVRGETVVRDREFVAESAHGRFVPATPLWDLVGPGGGGRGGGVAHTRGWARHGAAV